MKKLFTAILLLICSFCIQAQEVTDSLLATYINETKELINNKDYKSAEEKIKQIVSLNKVVPDEMAYFYGITQFGLEKYKTSKAALEKYLSLTGKKGEHFRDAASILKDINCIETGYFEQYDHCDMCYGSGREKVTCDNCKGKGKSICVACKGTGVSKQEKSLGSSYHTCGKCNGSGATDCLQCNGSKSIEVSCVSCSGSGYIKYKRKCKD